MTKERKSKPAPEYKRLVKPIVLVCLVVAVTYGWVYPLRFALSTETPLVVVISGSMEPKLRIGDLCLVRGVDQPQTLQKGDIIVFQSPRELNKLIIHRVNDITRIDEQWYFQTKGDNNPDPDDFRPYTTNGWVPFYSITGKVEGWVSYIGHAFIELQKPIGPILVGDALRIALIVAYLALEYFRPEKRA